MAVRPLLAALAAGLLLLAIGGCAATKPRQLLRENTWLREHPRVALVPLENLSSRPDAGQVLTRIFFVELVKLGTCEVVEPGDVEDLLSELGIRLTGAITSEQMRALGDSLDVRYLMMGSVLESGFAETSDGSVPALGVALRMVEAQQGRVVWAGLHFRTGEDHETVFGWGRERNIEKLGSQLAAELFEDLEKQARVMQKNGSGGSR